MILGSVQRKGSKRGENRPVLRNPDMQLIYFQHIGVPSHTGVDIIFGLVNLESPAKRAGLPSGNDDTIALPE